MSIQLPDTVKLVSGNGGLNAYEIKNEFGFAQLYLQGAHVAKYVPSGHEEVLAMSSLSAFADGQPIRGGIPICDPWFGFGPKGDQKPLHGTARLRQWGFGDAYDLPDGSTFLGMGLGDLSVPAHLIYNVTLGRAGLLLELITYNLGSAVLRREQMLHAYFSVGDIFQIEVAGLARKDYLDKANGLARVFQHDHLVTWQRGQELDRVYSTQATANHIITDPFLRRRISISKTGSETSVVWNPGKDKAQRLVDFDSDLWKTSICVEVGNALGQAIKVRPHQPKTTTMLISVERM